MAHDRDTGGSPEGRAGRRGGGSASASVDPDAALVEALERIAARLDIEIRREALDIGDARLPGGLCTVDGRSFCILSASLGPAGEARVLGAALLRFDLSEIYVPPAAREFLDRIERET